MSDGADKYKREKVLEDAVSRALPGETEAYFFSPILIMHINGSCYGVLSSANQALAWEKGLDAKARECFYLTDIDGARIIIKDNPRSPGHASAILDILQNNES